ncbi:hypothetical protein PENTCL1PPCAC_19669 [Pristionchus entomophagus]|uniref:ILEI/PANDER domain-containing protein n=1 Tax=Pristionchus entomophagus TaxID=358040 RepID=A0AAV5TU37_9BILA|nr:hypothetical protein PENTCL1PPCAC_19669 [Pristionchus entomophagus]
MRNSFAVGRRRPLLIIGSIVSIALIFSFVLSRQVTIDRTRMRYEPEVPAGAWVSDGERRGKGFSEKTSQGEEVLPPVKGEIQPKEEKKGGKIKDQKEEKRVASAKCAETFDTSCRSPQIHVRIGAETPSLPPYACFNDIAIFSEADIGRGLLAASIDDVTQEVKEVATFDLSTTDGRLIEWLGSLVPRAILVVVSFGDIAERLSPDARRALHRFGAQKAAEWRGGSAYAALGQRALEEGRAREILLPLGAAAAAGVGDINDCFEFPLGKLNATIEEKKDVNRVDETKLAELLRAQAGTGGANGDGGASRGVLLGEEWPQCGHTPKCGEDLLPMHFYSGANKDDHPRMCVGGRMVFAAGLNDAGRGLNVAVIDQKSRKIVKTGHFDTYEKDSTSLELFLDGLGEGDIVAVVSFDEASSMLSDMAKQIFYELGSSMVHRLKFRASWFFVGQKGIRVFSPFEDLNFPAGNAWATPIDASICVPGSLSGPSERRSDKQNAAKRHFCAKYDRLDEFCQESHLDDAIVSRPLTDPKRADDPIFNVPILVVAGESLGRVRLTLESLIAQPGINTQLVIVAHNKEYKMASDLALLFHFKPLPINATSKYNDLLLSSISAAFSIFPKATSLIVVESEVAATSGLLLFFSQLLPVMEKDESIQIVHAFNYNGFTRTSSSPSSVYRVDDTQPPSYIYLMRRSLYERSIGASGANLKACCSSLHRWSLSSLFSLSGAASAAAAAPAAVLVPDVSRVVVLRPDAITLADTGEAAVFREPRGFVKSSDERLADVEKLSEKEYEREMEKIEKASLSLDGGQWAACDGGYGSLMKKEEKRRDGKSLLIRYKDEKQVAEIIKCVGLYSNQIGGRQFVAGAYRGRIRFHLDGVPMMFAPLR